mmetsp:Transcript_4528/g.16796  ORF Transcript_4528/g.16796 Transcript_4528/m.16796 type:complete len:260 (-) Transcript_4528:36-815(-)
MAALLLVRPRRRQLRLRTQLLRLVVLAVVQVVPQQQVQGCFLADVVPPCRGDPVQLQKRAARVAQSAVPLVRQGEVKHQPRVQRVQGSAVEPVQRTKRVRGGSEHGRAPVVRQANHTQQMRVRLGFGQGALRRGGRGGRRRRVFCILALRGGRGGGGDWGTHAARQRHQASLARIRVVQSKLQEIDQLGGGQALAPRHGLSQHFRGEARLAFGGDGFFKQRDILEEHVQHVQHHGGFGFLLLLRHVALVFHLHVRAHRG